MYKTIEQRKQALKNSKIRKMKHFVMSDFNVPSGHFDAKNNIEFMTRTILDKLWTAWDMYCSAKNLGNNGMIVTRGWEPRKDGAAYTPFSCGMAVELAPANGHTELFQKLCATLFSGGVYKFDMISPTTQGVQIICKTSKIKQRGIVNLTEKL